MTYRWKPFLRFKRELHCKRDRKAVVTWHLAVCGLQFPIRITSQKQNKNGKIGQITTAFWRIFARLNISSYPEFAGEQATEHGKLTSI